MGSNPTHSARKPAVLAGFFIFKTLKSATLCDTKVLGDFGVILRHFFTGSVRNSLVQNIAFFFITSSVSVIKIFCGTSVSVSDLL